MVGEYSPNPNVVSAQEYARKLDEARMANELAKQQVATQQDPLKSTLTNYGIKYLTNGASTPSTYQGLPVGEPVASGANGEVLGAGHEAGAQATGGTPGFAFGAPSKMGTAAALVRGVKGGMDYFGNNGYEKDRNKQAVWDGGKAAANYFTGGTAELADLGAQKLLGEKNYGKLQSAYALTNPSYYAMNLVGSGKDKDQVGRDAVRSNLQKSGFLDKDFNLETIHGNKVNLGLDGGATPEYAGGRRPYEINTDNKFHNESTGWAQVLAAGISGGDRKLATQFGGYLSNAAMSDVDSIDGVRANMLLFTKKLGLNRESLEGTVNSLASQGKLSPEEAKAYMGGIQTLFGNQSQPMPQIPQGGGQQQMPFIKMPQVVQQPELLKPLDMGSLQTNPNGGLTVKAPAAPTSPQAVIDNVNLKRWGNIQG